MTGNTAGEAASPALWTCAELMTGLDLFMLLGQGKEGQTVMGWLHKCSAEAESPGVEFKL